MAEKLVLSDVFKKDLKIVAYLAATWLVGLVVVWLSGDEKWLGLVPVANYLFYRLEKELKKEGYVEVLRK